MSYEENSAWAGGGTSLLPDIRADEKPQIASECSRMRSLWRASSMSVGRKIQGQLSARMATRSVRSREKPSRESRTRRRSTWPRVVGRESGPGTAVPAKAGRNVRRRFASSTALSMCTCLVLPSLVGDKNFNIRDATNGAKLRPRLPESQTNGAGRHGMFCIRRHSCAILTGNA